MSTRPNTWFNAGGFTHSEQDVADDVDNTFQDVQRT